jgi:hypothetical protein
MKLYAKGGPACVTFGADGVLRMKTRGVRDHVVGCFDGVRGLLAVSQGKEGNVYVVFRGGFVDILPTGEYLFKPYPRVSGDYLFAGRVRIRRDKQFIPELIFDHTESPEVSTVALVDGRGTQVTYAGGGEFTVVGPGNLAINDSDDAYFSDFLESLGPRRSISFAAPLSKATLELSDWVSLRCALAITNQGQLLFRCERVDRDGGDHTVEYRCVRLPPPVASGLTHWGWDVGQSGKRDFNLYINAQYETTREYHKVVKFGV